MLDQITHIAGVEINTDGSPKHAYEQVDHPRHYQMPGGIEVIDLVEHLPFSLGNCVKYICRAGQKPGVDALTDLRKASWYLAREIARLEGRP